MANGKTGTNGTGKCSLKIGPPATSAPDPADLWQWPNTLRKLRTDVVAGAMVLASARQMLVAGNASPESRKGLEEAVDGLCLASAAFADAWHEWRRASFGSGLA
jgi:hypothetical protein